MPQPIKWQARACLHGQQREEAAGVERAHDAEHDDRERERPAESRKHRRQRQRPQAQHVACARTVQPAGALSPPVQQGMQQCPLPALVINSSCLHREHAGTSQPSPERALMA